MVGKQPWIGYNGKTLTAGKIHTQHIGQKDMFLHSLREEIGLEFCMVVFECVFECVWDGSVKRKRWDVNVMMFTQP